MSCLLLLAGGEVLSREDYIQAGKTKLRSILHYTQMNTGFSEYNSSSYTWVSLFEIVRMKRYFRDFNDREIATNLECIVWKMVAKHYNTELLQLTPPQARSYRDLDNGFYSLMVAIGTSGKYGRIPKLSVVSVEALMLWPRCPATVLSEFIPTTRWLVDYFYRRNDLRQSNEDHVIIRELDSPDRVGYSYKTSTYSLGCFGVSDCWNQRRNAMVIWGDGAHAGFLRVRGMIDDYDFSSAMLYCTQSKNRLLGHLGYCWDRGSFHYILDNDGKGEYVGSKLYFCVEYHLCPGDRVKFQDGQLLIEGQSTNTIVTFRRWQINGQNGRIWHDAARHRVVLLVKTGDGQLNLRALAKGISGVFTIDVNASPAPVTTMDEHGILHSELTMPNHQLKLVSPSNIGRYADAVQISMAGREHNDVK